MAMSQATGTAVVIMRMEIPLAEHYQLCSWPAQSIALAPSPPQK
jgi:hypothetical protein